MNVKKRDQYTNNLYAALHTLSGKAQQVNFSTAKNEPTVKKCFQRQDCIYLQLNPNKVAATRMLKKYSEFQNVLDATLQHIEVTDFQITRADLSFNSDDENDYELFKKINRLLICCIAQAYNVKNCYQSYDLWTNRSLSVAIKGDTFEAENYNKELESHGQVETKNRLELRSKRINGSLEHEFLNKWFDRLDVAIMQFTEVQNHYNAELIRIWNEDISKPEKDRDFTSLTAFLLRYKDCLFTRNQLENLYQALGFSNFHNKAKHFKDKHKIEFYSLTDLKVIVKAIKKATIKYFSN